jgi:uncharacterized protein YodC (DUF2158 family)
MEIGQLVQLKSGGPTMVVSDLNRTASRTSVTAVWYNTVSGKAEKEAFFFECLNEVDRSGAPRNLPYVPQPQRG